MHDGWTLSQTLAWAACAAGACVFILLGARVIVARRVRLKYHREVTGLAAVAHGAFFALLGLGGLIILIYGLVKGR